MMGGTSIKTKCMYKASITSKKISDGKLTVSVLFESEDTNETFTDTFETTQEQDASWIGKQIEARVKNLNSLPNLMTEIEIGPYVINEANSSRKKYEETSSLYLRYMDAARQGYIQSDYPKIVELREWLRLNFKDEYLTFL